VTFVALGAAARQGQPRRQLLHCRKFFNISFFINALSSSKKNLDRGKFFLYSRLGERSSTGAALLS
jgi:hypothetical protein